MFPKSEDPSNSDYSARLHAARLADRNAIQNQKPEEADFSAEYQPPSGDDYDIELTGAASADEAFNFGDDSGDDTSDFEAGYEQAVGGGFLKERLISWATGVFAPPGLGPFFGGGTSLMQWIFRENESPSSTSVDTTDDETN